MKHRSYSQRAAIHKCPKEYYYSKVKCMFPKRQKAALMYGSILHSASESLFKKPLYLTTNLNNSFKIINRKIAEINTINFNSDDFKNLRLFSAMAKAHIKKYYQTIYQEKSKDGTQVVEIEKRWEVPIINPATGCSARAYSYIFIPDRVEFTDGELWLISIKTTSNMGQADIDRLYVDQQALTELMYLERIYDKQFAGIKYEFFLKPSIKPKQIPSLDASGKKQIFNLEGERVYKKDGTPKESATKADGQVMKMRGETESEFIDRLEIIIDEAEIGYIRQITRRITRKDIEECAKDLWNDHKYMMMADNEEWYIKNTSACNIYGSCKYMKICKGSIPTEEIGDHYEIIIKEGSNNDTVTNSNN